MRAIVQRVKSANVQIDGQLVAEIESGLLIFLGISIDDQQSDIDYLIRKIANLRIFRDDDLRMNKSLLDVGGQALVVSQFTLYGDCRKGRRPNFSQAAKPEKAHQLYQVFVNQLLQLGVDVKTGVFQATMEVELTNDGPITILLDSKKLF
ncbi:D-aminoacyl-tRNA deacylase [Candidatus Poribacteria bacterium]|nr:D-aminoacyl-tRNA deacylase [Candidatus Poribacteria bacterium]|tara:strand:+ start:991 stop:1440 length:450 start_codon:yes stop_codon:yes gene_type:complete